MKIINYKPAHGYEIIKKVELCSKGRWVPSAGSIYPTLEGLESNGLIQSEELDRRKVYSITYQGVVALDIMTKEKLELLNEMSRIINFLTESGNNTGAPCEGGNCKILGAGKRPEKAIDADFRSKNR